MCHSGRTTARIASSCAAGVPRAEPASRLRSLTFPQPDGCFPDGGASRGTAHCDLIVGCPPMAIAASPVMRSTPLTRCRGACRDDVPQREANLTTGPGVIAGRTASRWLAPGAASDSPSHPPKRSAFDHEIRRPRHSRRSFRRAAARPTPKSLPTSPRSRLDLCHSPAPSIRRWGRWASLTAGPCSADESGTIRAIADCESPVSSMGFVPLRDFDRAPHRPTVSSLSESRFPPREPTPRCRHL